LVRLNIASATSVEENLRMKELPLRVP
jgi:hypothetical protein